MRFMKGLDAPTMIAIIIAVIAGIIILYFLWSKGMLPFLGGATEATCRTDLSKVCSGSLTWDEIKSKDKSCSIYFSGTQKTQLSNCLAIPAGSPDTADCSDFCSAFLGG